MPVKRLSDLTIASTIAGSDRLLLLQDGADKTVAIAILLAGLAPLDSAAFTGTTSFNGGYVVINTDGLSVAGGIFLNADGSCSFAQSGATIDYAGNLTSNGLTSQTLTISSNALSASSAGVSGICNPDGTQSNQIGFLGIPDNNFGYALTGDYTVAPSDNGRELYFAGSTNATVTIPDGLPPNMCFSIYSDSVGTITVTTYTDDLVQSPGGSEGSFSIEQFSNYVFRHVTSTRWSRRGA